MRIVITGGAGFVGSSLAVQLKRDGPKAEVVAFDSLRRPGVELGLPRVAESGVDFIRGDIRVADDLAPLEYADIVIHAAAEPSAGAGMNGQPSFVFDANVLGTFNVLEFARRNTASVILLSTNRVYPIAALRDLPLRQIGDRVDLKPELSGDGWSMNGVKEDFWLDGSRSLYGATKLAAEVLTHEYGSMFGLRTIVNRCGVIAGPWQMGKVEQGFVSLWVARHVYGVGLSYIGFGGQGLQVRDVLHVHDLCDLIALQLNSLDLHAGRTYNVGGGRTSNTSLRELTGRCESLTGRSVDVNGIQDTRISDIPWYITDHAAVSAATGWSPRRSLDQILADTHEWICRESDAVRRYFAP